MPFRSSLPLFPSHTNHLPPLSTPSSKHAFQSLSYPIIFLFLISFKPSFHLHSIHATFHPFKLTLFHLHSLPFPWSVLPLTPSLFHPRNLPSLYINPIPPTSTPVPPFSLVHSSFHSLSVPSSESLRPVHTFPAFPKVLARRLQPFPPRLYASPSPEQP